MEWLSEDIDRGQAVLTCIALAITSSIIWVGRKSLSVSIPLALLFLFLAAIAIPSFIPARPTAFRNACINNLRLIREAKVQWAQSNHKLQSDVPTEEDLKPMLPKKIICPLGGKYTIGAVGEDPACSLVEKGHSLK